MRSRTAFLPLRRWSAALATGGAFAWLIAALGPAGPVTAATTGSTTSSSGGAALTRTETKTVTEPARTDTVTETSTAQSGNTASVTHHTASVQLTPASSTSDQSSSSGLPAWGWVLIGVGAVLAAVAIFMVGRHSGKPPPGGAGTPGSPVRS